MLRIGICDDHLEGLRETERWCRRYLTEHNIEAEVIAVQHWEQISEEKLDLLFLDVEMPGMDGISIMNELESEERPLILFVTGYEGYMKRAYGKNVMGFIQKPIEAFDFNLSIERSIRVLTAGKIIALEEEGFVSTEKVQMIETDDRYTVVVLAGGKKVGLSRKGLSAWEEELADVYFIRIGNSHLINCKYIHTFKGNVIVMKSGQQYKVSKRRKTACYDKFMEYIKRYAKHA